MLLNLYFHHIFHIQADNRKKPFFVPKMKGKDVFILRDAHMHIFITENILNQFYGFDKGVLFVGSIQHF